MTDPRFAGDVDPFRGQLSCPAGTVRDDSAPWLARRFSGTSALDNGLLSLELLLEWEWTDDFDADVAALQDCAAIEAATLELTTGDVTVATSPSASNGEYAEITIRSPATDDVPYPSTMAGYWVHLENVTVVAIFSGVETTVDWSEGLREVALRSLIAIVDPAAATSPT